MSDAVKSAVLSGGRLDIVRLFSLLSSNEALSLLILAMARTVGHCSYYQASYDRFSHNVEGTQAKLLFVVNHARWIAPLCAFFRRGLGYEQPDLPTDCAAADASGTLETGLQGGFRQQ